MGKGWIVGFVLVGAVAVIRVASTHSIFSEVLDEPAHIACGYDWLKGAPYTTDPAHPPLARVLSAVPALIDGVPRVESRDDVARGNAILYYHDRYEHNLARARWPNLSFLALAIAAVAWCALRKFSPPEALLATGFLTALPPILGHAGVATTDMSVTAALPFATLLLHRFLDRPNIGRSIGLGAGIAMGLLAKFSFLVFFPISAITVVALRYGTAFSPDPTAVRRVVARTGIVMAVVFALVWAGYRFETRTIDSAFQQGADVVAQVVPQPFASATRWIGNHVPLPAPMFLVGLAIIRLHDREGHFSYLLGRTGQHGWWYYFPVVFFYKTPIPFLILVAWGIGQIIRSRDREQLEFVLIPIAVMLAVLPSSINIGVRHILPIYAPLCIVAAHASMTIWNRAEKPFGRVALVTLLGWMFIGTAAAHPDYLAWFNEAAGRRPERIVVDSNLDWGQDVLRLAEQVRKLGIDRISILYVGNARLRSHGILADPIQPWKPAPGWYVLSETALALRPEARLGAYGWLDAYDMQRIGKSMRIYHVPDTRIERTPSTSPRFVGTPQIVDRP